MLIASTIAPARVTHVYLLSSIPQIKAKLNNYNMCSCPCYYYGNKQGPPCWTERERKGKFNCWFKRWPREKRMWTSCARNMLLKIITTLGQRVYNNDSKQSRAPTGCRAVHYLIISTRPHPGPSYCWQLTHSPFIFFFNYVDITVPPD